MYIRTEQKAKELWAMVARILYVRIREAECSVYSISCLYLCVLVRACVSATRWKVTYIFTFIHLPALCHYYFLLFCPRLSSQCRDGNQLNALRFILYTQKEKKTNRKMWIETRTYTPLSALIYTITHACVIMATCTRSVSISKQPSKQAYDNFALCH